MNEEQSNLSERSVKYVIEGAKVLVPFGIALWTIFTIQADTRIRLELLQSALSNESEIRARLEGRVDGHEQRLRLMEQSVTEITMDIKHIKEDTKQTLDLIREYVAR